MHQRFAQYMTVAFFLLTLTSCSTWMTTPIQEIKDKPREYADKRVKVAGTVSQTFSLLVLKGFVLNDGTGDIYVVTKKVMPAEGEQITVKGTVREAFSLGDRHVLILLEDGKNAEYELFLQYLRSE